MNNAKANLLSRIERTWTYTMFYNMNNDNANAKCMSAVIKDTSLTGGPMRKRVREVS